MQKGQTENIGWVENFGGQTFDGTPPVRYDIGRESGADGKENLSFTKTVFDGASGKSAVSTVVARPEDFDFTGGRGMVGSLLQNNCAPRFFGSLADGVDKDQMFSAIAMVIDAMRRRIPAFLLLPNEAYCLADTSSSIPYRAARTAFGLLEVFPDQLAVKSTFTTAMGGVIPAAADINIGNADVWSKKMPLPTEAEPFHVMDFEGGVKYAPSASGPARISKGIAELCMARLVAFSQGSSMPAGAGEYTQELLDQFFYEQRRAESRQKITANSNMEKAVGGVQSTGSLFSKLGSRLSEMFGRSNF